MASSGVSLQGARSGTGIGPDAVQGDQICRQGETTPRWTVADRYFNVSVQRHCYHLKDNAFGLTKDVAETDPGYARLGARVPTAAEQRAQAVLDRRLQQEPPAGSVQEWLGGRRPKDVVNFASVAAPPERSGGGFDIVASAGAADCIIVGGVGRGSACLAHLDQTSSAGDIIGALKALRRQGGEPCIYLASGKFAKPDAASAKNLQQLLDDLQAAGFEVTAIYPTKQLALHRDGRVLAQFDPVHVNDGRIVPVGWGLKPSGT